MNDRSFFNRDRPVTAFLALGVLFMAGCAPSLGSAVRSYEHGRYPEAIEELRAVENDAAHWSSADAARYALYRGLAHLALGDVAATRLWLDRVTRATTVDPGAISAEDATRLASAQAHLPP